MRKRKYLNIPLIFNWREVPCIIEESQSEIEVCCFLADELIATEVVLVYFELVICVILLNQGYHFADAIAC